MPDNEAMENSAPTPTLVTVKVYDVATDTYVDRHGVTNPDGSVTFPTGETYTREHLWAIGYIDRSSTT